jgi:hypothetical protein
MHTHIFILDVIIYSLKLSWLQQSFAVNDLKYTIRVRVRKSSRESY